MTIPVDLLVPEAVAGRGRRSARLEGHGDRTARKTRALEAALVDHLVMSIGAHEAFCDGGDLLPARDTRCFDISVAGPAALLVAKLHKIADRAQEAHRSRVHDKDALDLFRLLQVISTDALAVTLEQLLETPMASDVTAEAVAILQEFFTTPRSRGCLMVVRATEGLEDAETIARSCSILANALYARVGRARGLVRNRPATADPP